MSDVIVIGGGPSGMFAAYHAACGGHSVLLLEQNEKLGKKLFITGKGRCNLTNAGSMEDLFSNVVSNPKFLYSAFYACSNESVMAFFKERGLALKTERGNRVFPESDHSSDVIAALEGALREKGVQIGLNSRVEKLLTDGQAVTGVQLADKSRRMADHVIVACGGRSYPATGSTGDGYRFAKETGHGITAPSPSLVPLVIREEWCRQLQGLSLRNVSVRILDGRKVLYKEFGEMLFTHFGVSGPLILSASAALSPEQWKKPLRLEIDLKPALSAEQLDQRILRDFKEAGNRQYKNALSRLYPAKLLPVMITLSGIDPAKKAGEVTREERRRLAELTKHLTLTPAGLRGWAEAIVTKGGVSVKDVNPSTMESKKAANLSFCGEVLDVDAMTGGYNLQIAWSTGYLAGTSIK